MDMVNKDIVRAIRERYGVDDADTVAEKAKTRKGVMAKDVQRNVEEAMQSTAESALETMAYVMDKTTKSRTKPEEMSIEDFDNMTLRSAEEAALKRMESGITESLKGGYYEETNGIMSKPSAVGVQPTDGKVYNSPDEMTDLEILARTIEAEAGVEEYSGKVAVGAVIANRAASGKYGKGIKGVILKKGQFSPWNSWTGYAKGEQGRDMMKLVPSEESYKAAMSILKGEYEDETGGATHYLDPRLRKPDWFKTMQNRKRGTVKLGTHVFGNADSDKTYDGKSWILKGK